MSVVKKVEDYSFRIKAFPGDFVLVEFEEKDGIKTAVVVIKNQISLHNHKNI